MPVDSNVTVAKLGSRLRELGYALAAAQEHVGDLNTKEKS